jgi:hypothetical protein
MAKRTGKDLAFLIATTAVKCARGWSVEDQDESVDTTCAGDGTVDSDSLRGNYTVEAETLLEIAAPYVIPNAVRGTKVAWGAKIIAGDTNSLVTSTGRVDRFRIEAAYNEAVKAAITIKAAGTALSWNLSPA